MVVCRVLQCVHVMRVWVGEGDGSGEDSCICHPDIRDGRIRQEEREREVKDNCSEGLVDQTVKHVFLIYKEFCIILPVLSILNLFSSQSPHNACTLAPTSSYIHIHPLPSWV